MHRDEVDAAQAGLLERRADGLLAEGLPSTPTTTGRVSGRVSGALPRTTTTGQRPWLATDTGVEPSSASPTRPVPEEPSTSIRARADRSMSQRALPVAASRVVISSAGATVRATSSARCSSVLPSSSTHSKTCAVWMNGAPL